MLSSDSDAQSDHGEQIRISLKLASSLKDQSLKVPSEPIAVPSDIGRKGLSAVINHLLGRSHGNDKNESDSEDDEEVPKSDLPPITFEFILSGANNRLLRKGVEKEARQYGLSLEQAIEIVYFPAAEAPELSEDKEQLPDWISGLSVWNNSLFAGCYDGSVHIYSISDGQVKEVSTTGISPGPIKCLTTKQCNGSSDTAWLATASLSHTLHLHSYNETANTLTAHGMCTQEGQSSPVSSLSFSGGSSDLLASGDGDGTVCIWDPNSAEEDSSKRAKKSGGVSKSSSKRVRPTTTLEAAHTQLVSGISWGNSNPDNTSQLITGSWDHSIKLWDVEKQDCLLTLNGSRVVACLDTSYHSDGVVATGHPDCTIRLWDMRTSGSKQSAIITDNTFRPSHKAWVSDVSWSEHDPFHLSSTSHDGTVKLWDIRSSTPLHSIRAFPKEEKALSLAVFDPSASKDAGSKIVFAGGTDCILKQLGV